MKIGRIDPWPYLQDPITSFSVLATRGPNLFINRNAKLVILVVIKGNRAKIRSDYKCSKGYFYIKVVLFIYFGHQGQVYLVNQPLKRPFRPFQPFKGVKMGADLLQKFQEL